MVNRNEYPLYLEAKGAVANYDIYKVIFSEPVSLTSRNYDLVLYLDDISILIGTFLFEAISVSGSSLAKTFNARNIESGKPYYGLSDKNEPIDIVDRSIVFGKSQNTIVGEDNISQLITFRMPQYYDGIDMATKEFYLDYVSPSGELFNLPLINKEVKELSVGDAQEPEPYLYFYWPVPYDITKYNKNISFAISAIDIGLTSDAPDANGAVNTKAT